MQTFPHMKWRWQLWITALSLMAIVLSLSFQTDYPLYVVIVLGGIPSVLQIVFKLWEGDLGADSLAAIAVFTAVILNQNLAAVILILMISSGQVLEEYAMRKASSVLAALADRMPTIVHRKISDSIEDIPLLEIQVGDTIVVFPHETIPVDGIVLEGRSLVDESYLTGEPYQISKVPGTAVISGAINGESVLTIRAQKLPSESRYASIVAVLTEAEQRRPKLRRLGDQIGAVFAPISLLLSVAAWYFTGDVLRFLSVLVVATPCPLLIAIPITIISAISMAAKHSIIIKDPTVLERLPTCRTAIFDKTGTLTYGKPSLSEIVTIAGVKSDQVLQQAASLERYSKHPLARAILYAAEQRHLPFLNATSVTEQPGKGLSGIVETNEIHITHRKQILQNHPEMIAELPPSEVGLECVMILNGQYLATFRFRDVPREETQPFIHHLEPMHQFTKVMLVSGDRESEVNYLGKLLNLSEIHASQSPEQKLQIVREEMKSAPTLFMGDGINDAPALTAATVGVAFGQFSQVTAEAAGAVVMEHTLSKVDELFHLSLSTRKIALQSALGGMLCSFLGMGFAAAGYLTPVTGAILQEFIDVLAILNALRLIWSKNIETDFL